MPRLLFVLLLVLATVVLGAGALFALTYGGDALPTRTRLEGLSEPAEIQVFSGGPPVLIKAATETDALRALGYAQATSLTWPLLVARQAARAELTLWMGRDALRLDRHVALLGFGADAQNALATLNDRDRETLQAFADGVTAGLRDAWPHDRFVGLSGVTAPDSFSVLDVLSIERLFGWTATRLVVPDSVTLPAEAAFFLSSDSLFRRTIGLDGWAQSAAWSFRDSTETVLTARYETGQSALLTLFETFLVVDGDTSFAAYIPGTPFPLVRSERRASVVVPRATATLGPASAGGWERHEVSLRTARGGLLPAVQFRRGTQVLLAADTTGTTSWSLTRDSGSGTTDAPVWLALSRGDATSPTFSLLPEATTLLAGAQGTTRIGPGAAYREGEVSADMRALPHLQVRLDSLSRQRPRPPAEWYRDAVSPWALGLRNQLVSRIDTALFTSPVQHTAFEYFRNWSGSFRETSIGATVFDVFARRLGLDPNTATALADTSQPFVRAHYSAEFSAATDTLVARHGANPLNWRWELLHPDVRTFPLWSAQPDIILSFETPAVVAPFTLPGAGHPTTLRGGTAGPEATRATHVVVVQAGAPLATQLFRLDLGPVRAFARYRVEGHPYPARTLRVLSEPDQTFTLLPDAR